MKNLIDCIPNVTTQCLNMFRLHELKIENELVAYIRYHEAKIEVIPLRKYSIKVNAQYFVSIEQFKEMIAKFVNSNRVCFY